VTSSREAPHDLGAERALISAAILDADAYALVAGLPAHRMYSEPHRRIWEAIAELAAAGSRLDVVTIAGKLRDNGRLNQVGGETYLAELLDAVPAVAHVEDYADRVLALGRLRELIAQAQKIAAEGYDVRGDVQAFIDHAENSVFQIAHTEQRREIVSFAHAGKESWQNILAAHERRGKVEFPTGLDRLDHYLALRRGELTTVAARPAMGKTSLVLGAATHLAELGNVVSVFELEMARDQLATRITCARAGIDLHRVMQGFIRTEEWGPLVQAKESLYRLPIWIDDSAGMTLMRVRAGARKTKAKAGRLDLVVVDYLQLMSAIDDRDNASREQEISTNMRGLKRLARELDVPVIVLAQLNRKCEERPDKRPMLSDLRESGAIEQDSDNVLFIYRPEYYQKEKTPPDDRGIAELVISKQRNGPTGVVRVRFDAHTASFANLQVEDDQQGSNQEQFPFNEDTPEAHQ
jgi:replicative DNA helicase